MAKKALKINGLVIFAILLCARPATSAEGKRTQVPVKGLASLEMRLISGEVRVMAWNGDYVTIESGKTPIAKTIDKGTLTIGYGEKIEPIPSGNIKIYAPEHLQIKIVTDHAKVDVQGFASRIQVATMDGEVRVSSCFAPVEIETVTGSIEALDLKGDISLITVSGTIEGRNIQSAFFETKSVNGTQSFSNIKAKRLRLRSHSGPIEVDSAAPDSGVWEVSTFDGLIEMSFKRGAALELEAQSRFGQVRVRGEIEQRDKAGNYFKGRAKSGDTLVRVTTFNGSIDVEL